MAKVYDDYSIDAWDGGRPVLLYQWGHFKYPNQILRADGVARDWLYGKLRLV
jgi:hypothetical protein